MTPSTGFCWQTGLVATAHSTGAVVTKQILGEMTHSGSAYAILLRIIMSYFILTADYGVDLPVKELRPAIASIVSALAWQSEYSVCKSALSRRSSRSIMFSGDMLTTAGCYYVLTNDYRAPRHSVKRCPVTSAQLLVLRRSRYRRVIRLPRCNLEYMIYLSAYIKTVSWDDRR